MADLMAIVSKARFERGGEIPRVGQVLGLDRYTSASKTLEALAEGGRLFLVTVRPGEEIWLVGVLEDPRFDAGEWTAAPSTVPIVDITHLRDKLRFKTGKGIAGGVSLGSALQAPRQISDGDRALLDKAIAGAPRSESEATESVPVVNRAERDELFHHFERAKSARSKCATCDKPLLKGGVRLAEVYVHGDIRDPIYRYHHVDCGIATVPQVSINALALTEEASLVDAADVTARATATLDAQRAARREAFAAKQLPVVARELALGVSAKLLEQLESDPDDRATLEVLADELQAKGDPRGELITVQLALAAMPTAKARGPEIRRGRIARDERSPEPDELSRLASRRDELTRSLAPQLDAGDRFAWGIGFVRRLELASKTAPRIDETAAIWQHPSLRMLRELRITWASAREGAAAVPTLAACLPPSLRHLELGGSDTDFLGEVSKVVAALPQLATFVVSGRGDYAELAHPSLARLEIVGSGYGELTAVVQRLSPAKLPGVRTLVIRGTSRVDDGIVDALATQGWLGRVDELAIVHGQLEGSALAGLAAALGKRKLRRLDLTGMDLPIKLRATLASLCDELVFPITASAGGDEDGLAVEHTGKPEWGIGKIIKRKDGKVEVEFAKAGVKVFKADAPFLRVL